MKRKITVVLIILFLIPLTTANVLIEPPETQKDISGLETGFEIGFVNTGSEAVNISFSSEKSTKIQLDYPSKIELPVSQITSTPEGNNWYYLGDGNYAKVKYVQINSQIPLDTNTRRHNFDLSLSRVYETSKSRPNVEQVQEFNFEVFSISDRINTGFQTTEEPDSTNSTEDDETIAPGKNNEQQDEGAENTVNETEKDPAQTPQNQGINGVTILLIVGIVLCAAWLIKEVI